MLTIQHRKIEGLPFLEVVEEKLKNKAVPVVFFYHGWTNVKESMLVYGYELAKRGMRAILPDARFHGERRDDLDTKEHQLEFWEIVLSSICEFATLTTDLKKRGLLDPQKIGVSGLSMGGITACGLLATYPEIQALDCLMGTPQSVNFAEELLHQLEESGVSLPEEILATLPQLHPIDLSKQPEKLAGKPVHFWHGKKDQAIPYSLSLDFYNENKVKDFGKNLTYSLTDDEHKVPYAIAVEMAQFFQRHLILDEGI